MSTVDSQIFRQLDLRPLLLPSERLDALSQFDAKGVITAGHCSMMAISLGACVWHARQRALLVEFWPKLLLDASRFQ
jgi:hypothetical protein